MNETIEIGRINRLRIERHTAPGLYLSAANEDELLLPNQYVTENMNDGDEIDVFVYTDSEDRPVASTQLPKAMLGEFGFFEVVDTTRFGAFVDWGLPKDLFVPNSLQKKPFRVGDKRILYVIKDEQTNRLVGTEKSSEYLMKAPRTLPVNSEVKLLLLAKTPLGYKVIVDNAYEGLIFHNELFEDVRTGDCRKGYIKQVRKDGKLDISLQPIGGKKDDIATEKIIALLRENNGMLPYNYKSDADQISSVFGLSKKVFKRALTQLQESGEIKVQDTGIFSLRK